MDKKSLSESDICAKFITPALVRAGWDEASQILWRSWKSGIKNRILFLDGKWIAMRETLSRQLEAKVPELSGKAAA